MQILRQREEGGVVKREKRGVLVEREKGKRVWERG
jgi:hypothetical protein